MSTTKSSLTKLIGARVFSSKDYNYPKQYKNLFDIPSYATRSCIPYSNHLLKSMRVSLRFLKAKVISLKKFSGYSTKYFSKTYIKSMLLLEYFNFIYRYRTGDMWVWITNFTKSFQLVTFTVEFSLLTILFNITLASILFFSANINCMSMTR